MSGLRGVVAVLAVGTMVNTFDTDDWGPGTDGALACKKLAAKKAKVPAKLRAPKHLELDGPATAIMAQWGAHEFGKLFDGSHRLLRQALGSSAIFARLARLFEARAGKFVKIGAPLAHSFKDSSWVVSAPLVYEKGTLTVALSFQLDEGTPKLTNFDLELPKALQAAPDNKAAAAAARSALGLLLAAKIDAFSDRLHPDAAKKLRRASFEPGLKKLLEQLGTVQSIEQTEQVECEGHQCLTFEVKSAKGTSKATFEMTFLVAEWEVYGFSLDPPE